MSALKRGDFVRLIWREEDMPPVGAIGEVISDFDITGDADVMLWGYACPVQDPSWVCNRAWLKKINPPAAKTATTTDKEIPCLT